MVGRDKKYTPKTSVTANHILKTEVGDTMQHTKKSKAQETFNITIEEIKAF